MRPKKNKPAIYFVDSPLVLLATLISARRSRDYALERLAQRRLAEMGIKIQFASDKMETK